MLSINTNLSSLIAQNSLTQSTSKLNQAIERMSTGYKINHASDNAANYSISTNMTTKMNSYMVAEDNVSMGLDMVTTLSENLSLVSEHVQRIRDLCEQASNGTYGQQSIQAIQSEIDARLAEISRLKSSAEFNGIKLLDLETPSIPMFVTGSFIQEVDQLTEEEAIAQGYTIIKTADELQAMKDNLSGKYILMNDIDLEGYDWTPVGTDWSNDFSGELNGNGFVIKNLTINKPTEFRVGLFGYTNNATIKNLGIEDAEIIGRNAAILVGELSYTTIENCYVTGSVLSAGNSDYAGGITSSSAEGRFNYCYSNSNVEGRIAGGLVGSADAVSTTSIFNSCYSQGVVKGEEYVGGLIGISSIDEITNCYSTCEVSGNSYVGGFLGLNDSSTVSNCYWDTEKSGTLNDNGQVFTSIGNAEGKTTSELQSLIDNSTLPKAKTPSVPNGNFNSITLQIGTNSDSNSQITFDLATTLSPLEITITDSDSARMCLSVLDNYLAQISDYQTNLGAVTNRLESALDEIAIQYENLASSRSTIRDADIAEVSSIYIQQQILQQASATLLSTANQSPSIALQLI